ncbi:hypothetical protein JTE90_011544 [Oedothorax gibbosus]|uniref:Uncharacterized protein n=1 Tax=Oedothorax gibbosus TaxID=931172 RepID=A0AAV6UKA5_9ARAC|nr:hypothetical protein JTE90_011544 [Oedothorax gibbosus]
MIKYPTVTDLAIFSWDMWVFLTWAHPTNRSPKPYPKGDCCAPLGKLPSVYPCPNQNDWYSFPRLGFPPSRPLNYKLHQQNKEGGDIVLRLIAYAACHSPSRSRQCDTTSTFRVSGAFGGIAAQFPVLPTLQERTEAKCETVV